MIREAARAISIKAVTGKPIKFIGTGEKLDALEPFYPDRMASRILGMGDVVSLVEKAQEVFDEKQAKEFERKLRKDEFTLEDFSAADKTDEETRFNGIDPRHDPGAWQIEGRY